MLNQRQGDVKSPQSVNGIKSQADGRESVEGKVGQCKEFVNKVQDAVKSSWGSKSQVPRGGEGGQGWQVLSKGIIVAWSSAMDGLIVKVSVDSLDDVLAK